MEELELINRIEKRIFEHQKETGFETIFDFIGEDLIELKAKFNNVVLADVRLSLPPEKLIESLGECAKDNEYEIASSSEGRWWIIHKEVGSGEPLKQWLTGKPESNEA